MNYFIAVLPKINTSVSLLVHFITPYYAFITIVYKLIVNKNTYVALLHLFIHLLFFLIYTETKSQTILILEWREYLSNYEA